MRKMFWFTAAALVCAAVVIHLATHDAVMNPDSPPCRLMTHIWSLFGSCGKNCSTCCQAVMMPVPVEELKQNARQQALDLGLFHANISCVDTTGFAEYPSDAVVASTSTNSIFRFYVEDPADEPVYEEDKYVPDIMPQTKDDDDSFPSAHVHKWPMFCDQEVVFMDRCFDNPPECREDPYHHYQYSGCPYSGSVLSPRPEIEPVVQPAPVADISKTWYISFFPPTLVVKKSERDRLVITATPIGRRVEENGAEEQSLDQRGKRSVISEEEGIDWSRYAYPNVDTMDYRPSDARPGEFAPIPH